MNPYKTQDQPFNPSTEYSMDERDREYYKSMPVSSDELYANAIQEEKIKNIIAQLDPENQLRDIEWRIRGYKKNILTQEWEKVSQDIPSPPEELIAKFMSWLGSIMNQSLTHSNLSEAQINKIMKISIEYVSDELENHADVYGMENNYTERTRMGQIILNSTFFVLCRALNGQESKRFWKSLSLNENLGSDIQQKNRWMEALKFWK